MDKEKFWNAFVPAKTRRTINGGVTIAFLMALTCFVFFPVTDNKLLLALGLVYVVCGAGVLVLKSRVCAILLFIAFIPLAIMMFIYDSEYRRYGRSYSGRHKGGAGVFIITAGAVLFLNIYAVFKYQKIKSDYENGVNADFFSGKINPVLNPYSDEPKPMIFSETDYSRNTDNGYSMGDMPAYSQPNSPEEQYNYGSAKTSEEFDWTAPVQDYNEPWETEDINPNK